VRVLLQRVLAASVEVEEKIVAEIGDGVVLFVASAPDDQSDDLEYLVAKIVNLRIFLGHTGKFDRSLLDVEGEILLISQFTLYADTRKGRRPSFMGAARPEVAEPNLKMFANMLRDTGVMVRTGRFGSQMLVRVENDGPVTISFDSAERPISRRS
jgi:D-tyrosyl-tRNA(Tyr) deacylase